VKKSIVLVFIVLSFVILTGCNQSNKEIATTATQNASTVKTEVSPQTEPPVALDSSLTRERAPKPIKDIAAKHRAQSKEDTLSVEGSKREVTLKIVDSPAFEFSTYVPADMKVETATSGDGDTLTIYANFRRKLNKNAFVQFYSRPDGARTTVKEMAELAKQTAFIGGFEIREREIDEPNQYGFSDFEFDIAKGTGSQQIVGTVAIFQHLDRVYRVTVQYPVEYMDGFVPRVRTIFREMLWYYQS
jgi:hypothetical protein